MNQLIQQIQLADKYSRLKSDGTKETWPEVVERVLKFFKGELTKLGKPFLPEWEQDIRQHMLAMSVLPSMRVVQMAGPALERDHVGLFNCAFVNLDKPSALGELLYIMMQGTGVGFSVEQHVVAKWPTVLPASIATLTPWRIKDSTEGWVQAYDACIRDAMLGLQRGFIYDDIRPAGAPLKTKGGYASGPEPFKELLEFTRQIICGAAGRQLTPFEIHRLATKAGSIVMVGGVRRAAQISLSSSYDSEMRDCKRGEFWIHYPELAMANNSAVIQHRDDLAVEWTFLSTSGTGERGLFNPNGPVPKRRQQPHEIDYGTNPCSEVILRSRQFCNLSITVARPDDTRATLGEKVRVATLIGTIQSCLTHFPNLPDEWRKNCEEERLLGVDITGTMDCPLLQHTNTATTLLLENLRSTAQGYNQEYAEVLDINPSTAITCNKPSGNSSQLLDSSSGIHPRYAPFYIRRLRIGRDTPLAQHLVDMGVPVYPELGYATLESSQVWVFELPAKAPDGAITRGDVSALDQLNYWKMWKTAWCEHNPSCTVYVDQDEWDEVYQWVWANWDLIGGLSFLPKSNHVYQLAPYEEIEKEEYEKRMDSIKWDGNSLAGWAGEQAGATDAACAGNFCEF